MADNPSAPPEDVDDFSWISEQMTDTKKEVNKNDKKDEVISYPNLNNNNNDNNDNNDEWIVPKQKQPQHQGFQQPSDMAVPDAISQQVIYQKIMEENKKKKELAAKQAIMDEKKQEEPIFTQPKQEYIQPQYPNAPKPSYLSQDVQYPETALYTAAGICVWRPKSNGKGIQIMMGLEKSNTSLSFFGGKRDNNDKTAVDTALREFHEETAKQLDDDTLGQIRRMIISDKERRVFWKAEWKSYLFFYQMSYDYDIVKNYNKHKSFGAEMKSLHWVDFDKIYKSVVVTGNAVKINSKRYPLRSFVVGMLLHKDIRQYLLPLHSKHGGDMNSIQPRNGGTIRPTLDKFTNIPKAVRLDIINPITHNSLYFRWMDMEIGNIDDYQLLTSLISSVCPEIGMNFQLYYCNNQQFKLSKKQFPIDTIPKFNTLKKNLSAKKNHFITQLVIIPTFIISDNFKGCNFSFKSKDVSWKKVVPTDDEKGLISSLYNKASDIAQSWFGEGGDNDDDDNKNNDNNNYNNNMYEGSWNNMYSGYNDDDSSSMHWKWQFQNDNNKFEDCTKNNSKLIEKAFINGCSFAGYKKNGVPYQSNFKKMIQKNLTTKKIRAIRRVPGNTKSHKEKKNEPVVYNSYFYQSPALKYYKWQYQDDDWSWKDYDVSISKQLNSFKISWDNNVNNYHYTYYRSKKKFDHHYTKSIRVKNYNYLVDVKNFRQQNVSTKKERNVRQIPCYDHNYNNNLISLPYFMNNNNTKLKYKWQYKDDGYNNWMDYESSTSNYIENQFITNRWQSPFIVTITSNKNRQYKINLSSMKQQSLLSSKYRAIRRVQMYKQFGGGIKHKWEWYDDNNKWKSYNQITSNQIESACNSGIKKYFFVSNKNNNSYEINFGAMSQFNVQTGKQRNVRKIALKPKWKGAGPNPEKYKGPINTDRRTFDKKVIDLYCVVGDNISNEVKKSGKLIRGTLGPFGCGLYWYNSAKLAKEMAKNRNISNRGNLIRAKVFIGKEKDVSNMDDKQFDFITLQKLSFDSISRYIGIGKEYIVYNHDQVCIIKTEKYY